ncbi:MAG TPA: hypothetical protein VFM25_05280 [Verrucomicrobiae bacterium]|nr:hypothetical protein [Verrucomicrobiae bacterium]
MTKDIRERLQAQPLFPFAVHMADGREYNVPTPGHAHVSPSGGRVSIWTDDDHEFILPALLISGLKVRANGDH